jgi:acyl-CoA synthetase (AMP-forming)/AMP-acid ligase II
MNVAAHLARRARERADATAVLEPKGARGWRATTYAELGERSRRIAAGLADLGLARGDRAAVFVRPGADLVAIVYALFSIGVSPVLVDPGMGRKAVARCLASVAPRALVGVPAAHLLLSRSAVPSLSIAVIVGRRWFGRKPTLAALERSSPRPAEPEPSLRTTRPRSSSRRARPARRRASSTRTGSSRPRSRPLARSTDSVRARSTSRASPPSRCSGPRSG